MNIARFFAPLLASTALVFASGCVVETQAPEIIEHPLPSPEPTTKKISTSEITLSAHDEGTLLRVALACSLSPETRYTITFRETRTWELVDHERVVVILGGFQNVKLVFQN